MTNPFEPTSKPLELKIQSDPAEIAAVRRGIETFCRHCGYDDKACGEIGLCVNEAIANIIRHAYSSAPNQPISITVRFVQNILRISLRDWGNGMNPAKLTPKAPNPNVPGGLGLICMHSLMDQIQFFPQTDGMRLEMSRRLNRDQSLPAKEVGHG